MAERISWINFRGETVYLDEVDHQYLSNVVWHNTLVNDSPKWTTLAKNVKGELERRFNGQLLEYRPHINFTEEIQFLKRKGYLKDDEIPSLIVVNGTVIGRVVHNNFADGFKSIP